MPTAATPAQVALLASLTRASKRAAARSATRADVARANMATVDALSSALRNYWQGSASYLLDQDVAAGREIVIDGSETRESVAAQARALMAERGR